MSRRKTLLVVVILGLTALFLSPWTKAPVPETGPTALPEQSPEPLPVINLADEEGPANLKINAVIDEEGFELLKRQSGGFELQHPDITVDWTRIDPDEARLQEDIQDRLRTVDLMLIPNEWVRNLAVNGELQPVDSAFVGDALSEQFIAIISQMKWNTLFWGVPRDFDPYVLVWNRNVLSELKTESGPLEPPLTWQQWLALPQLLTDNGRTASWLAVSESDPQALLAWFGTMTGRGQDELFERNDPIWSSEELDRAIRLVDEQRSGIAVREFGDDFWPAFAAGQYVAAVVRSSEAARRLAELPDADSSALAVDRSAWKTSFAWPNGDSFVLSSRSRDADAAKLWLSEMTAPDRQLETYEQSGKLPALRSLYSSLDGADASLRNAASDIFPNKASLSSDPTLPEQFALLGGLWDEWLRGQLTSDGWKQQWLASLADSQSYD